MYISYTLKFFFLQLAVLFVPIILKMMFCTNKLGNEKYQESLIEQLPGCISLLDLYITEIMCIISESIVLLISCTTVQHLIFIEMASAHL